MFDDSRVYPIKSHKTIISIWFSYDVSMIPSKMALVSRVERPHWDLYFLRALAMPLAAKETKATCLSWARLRYKDLVLQFGIASCSSLTMVDEWLIYLWFITSITMVYS